MFFDVARMFFDFASIFYDFARNPSKIFDFTRNLEIIGNEIIGFPTYKLCHVVLHCACRALRHGEPRYATQRRAAYETFRARRSRVRCDPKVPCSTTSRGTPYVHVRPRALARAMRSVVARHCLYVGKPMISFPMISRSVVKSNILLGFVVKS